MPMTCRSGPPGPDFAQLLGGDPDKESNPCRLLALGSDRQKDFFMFCSPMRTYWWLLFAALSISSACGEPECPDGTYKIGHICKRTDAGNELVSGDRDAGLRSEASTADDRPPSAGGADFLADAETTAAKSDGGTPGAAADAGSGDATRIDAGLAEAGSTVEVEHDASPGCSCSGMYCLPGTAQCVECRSDNDCGSGERARCDLTSHTCARCNASAQCARFAELKVCTAGSCVECTTSEQSACIGTSKPVCASAGHVCVACESNSDCGDPSKPTCDANACRACRGDADCAGKTSGSTALDACYNGQCVDCRINVADTRQDVGCSTSNSCDPGSRTCNGKAKGSLSACQPCIADAECRSDHRCIPLNHRSRPVGNYCMRIATMGCSLSYTAGVLTRVSTSGAPEATYCGISEERTTCEAAHAFDETRTCLVARDCAGQGALCEHVNASAQLFCTYPCLEPRECPSTAPCGGPDGAKYCGGI